MSVINSLNESQDPTWFPATVQKRMPLNLPANKESCKIVFVGEAPGDTEMKTGIPFSGESGQEFSRMLAQIGINRAECFITNVFPFRLPNNNLSFLCGKKAEVGGKDYPYGPISSGMGGTYLRPEFFPELDRLRAEIEEIQPNIVCCLGNTALWALTGKSGIKKLRGTIMESPWGFKILATWHPAYVLRTWSARVVCLMDFTKLKRESQFPDVVFPEREIWIKPTIGDIYDFEALYFRKNRMVSVDIETYRQDMISCVGFAPNDENAIVIPFMDEGKKNWNYWESPNEEVQAWQIVCRLLRDYISLGQNFLYDVQYLWRDGCPPRRFEEDTMLLHHAYSPESPKDLGFQISLYTNERASKLLAPRGLKTGKREE